MNNVFLQSWWVLALRGVVGILFAVLALLWPGLTLLTLMALFAAYALVSGVGSVVGAVKHRQADDDWWLMLLIGLVGIGAGVVTLIRPGLTALVLVLLIGANALMTGVLDVFMAIRLRKSVHGEWLLVLNGIAAIVFGVLVFMFPGAGALALVWLISLYAFVTGVLLLALALRMRAMVRGGIAARFDRRTIPDRRVSTVHP